MILVAAGHHSAFDIVAANRWRSALIGNDRFSRQTRVAFNPDRRLTIDTVQFGVDPVRSLGRAVAAVCELDLDNASLQRIDLTDAFISSAILDNDTDIARQLMSARGDADYTNSALDIFESYRKVMIEHARAVPKPDAA